MKLSELTNLRARYRLPRDPFIDEVLIPSFRVATSVDCMFGYFSSGSLRQVAPGLAEFLARPSGDIRMLISPNLSEADLAALDEGTSTPLSVLTRRLEELLGNAQVTSSALINHTLTCLSYLLAARRIEIRFALVANGLFHPKVWMFSGEDDVLIAHGSSNMTPAGLLRNVESIRIEKPWCSASERDVAEEFRTDFVNLWDGKDPDTLILPIPKAIEERIIHEYHGERPPSAGDFSRFRRDEAETITIPSHSHTLRIPDGLRIYDGPFRHQGDAVAAWEAAGRRGILAMATGSGKTVTALVAASRLLADHSPLLVIVSAPYRPLVTQWEDEVRAFKVEPLPLQTRHSTRDRLERIARAVDALKSKAVPVEIAIVTEDLLTSDGFHDLLGSIPSDLNLLLIADEVHNLGAKGFLSRPPTRFQYRLGLSATPERQYDPEGTQELFEFFGNKVFEFPLERAIGTCLVPYNYHLHKVTLTDGEYLLWKDLTGRLHRAGFVTDADVGETGELSDDIQRLLNQRRAVLEAAENKLLALRVELARGNATLIRHTMIYATDKKPSQLLDVNRMLRDDLHVLYHQLTAEETADASQTSELLDAFAEGRLQIITCKRVLDEGVNIPEIIQAHLLASNTVERQWIQRRGRILRKCPRIEKKLAQLHDYLVVPPIIDKASRSILKGELRRAHEFARLADNAGDANGPFAVIDTLSA